MMVKSRIALQLGLSLLGAVLLLSGITGCASQQNNVDKDVSTLRFESVSNANDQAVFEPRCTRDVVTGQDSLDQPYVSFSFVTTPSCFGAFNHWVTEHLNTKVNLMFGDHKVSGPTLVVSRIGPSHIHVASKQHELLPPIQQYLSRDNLK